MRHHSHISGKLALGLACLLLCLGSATACSDETYHPNTPPSTTNPGDASSGSSSDVSVNGGQETEGTGNVTDTAYYSIVCDGNRYETSHEDAVAVDGSVLVLNRAGTYVISGERQGQIRVEVTKVEQVTLILDGFTASCETSAPLYIKSADRVFIEVPAGKTSTLNDTANYVFPAGVDKPNACLYGSDDLTFRGEGTLVVNGLYNNGIGCKNDVVIESGTIVVSAPNNAIKGNGSVTVTGTANVTVTNGEDGIKADSLTVDKGYVLIDGNAVVSITCLDDALQAVSYITVADTARVTYKCDGQAANGGETGIVNVAEGSMIPME